MISTMTQFTNTMSLEKAFKEIYLFRGVIPTKAYEVIADHQEEAIPLLIQTLKDAICKCDHTGDYYVAHIHAILLLSQFREKKAYPVIIDLLNLPIDSIDKLIGDMLTETISKAILSTYDGNPEPLFALLANRDADRFVRYEVARCFSGLLYRKMIDQETVILRIQEIVASGKMNDDQSFYTALESLTLEGKLEPLYDIIRAAFKAGMIYDDHTDLNEFERELLLPIEKLTEIEKLNPLANAANELAKWDNYNSDIPRTVKIERNTPCPCGSGSKFKKCCINML